METSRKSPKRAGLPLVYSILLMSLLAPHHCLENVFYLAHGESPSPRPRRKTPVSVLILKVTKGAVGSHGLLWASVWNSEDAEMINAGCFFMLVFKSKWDDASCVYANGWGKMAEQGPDEEAGILLLTSKQKSGCHFELKLVASHQVRHTLTTWSNQLTVPLLPQRMEHVHCHKSQRVIVGMGFIPNLWPNSATCCQIRTRSARRLVGALVTRASSTLLELR